MIDDNFRTDVSIIIVTYNSENYILKCIDSIKKYKNALNYEIIIIDNASQDATIRKLESEYKDLTIVNNDKNLGFAKACNQGLTLSNSKYIFFLNPDTILINNVHQILFNYMESPEAKNVWCCGAQLYNENNHLAKSYDKFPTIWDVLLEQIGFKGIILKMKDRFDKEEKEKIDENKKKVPFVIGSDLFIRRSVLDEIGSFNETFFLNYEETELAYRAQKSGYNSFIHNGAKIIHYGSKSFNSKKEYLNHLRDGQLNYFKITKHRFYNVLVKSLHLIGAILRIIIKLNFSQVRRIPKIISS